MSFLFIVQCAGLLASLPVHFARLKSWSALLLGALLLVGCAESLGSLLTNGTSQPTFWGSLIALHYLAASAIRCGLVVHREDVKGRSLHAKAIMFKRSAHSGANRPFQEVVNNIVEAVRGEKNLGEVGGHKQHLPPPHSVVRVLHKIGYPADRQEKR